MSCRRPEDCGRWNRTLANHRRLPRTSTHLTAPRPMAGIPRRRGPVVYEKGIADFNRPTRYASTEAASQALGGETPDVLPQRREEGPQEQGRGPHGAPPAAARHHRLSPHGGSAVRGAREVDRGARRGHVARQGHPARGAEEGE